MSFHGPEFLGFPPFGVVGTLYIRTYVGILRKSRQFLTGEFSIYRKRRWSNKEIHKALGTYFGYNTYFRVPRHFIVTPFN